MWFLDEITHMTARIEKDACPRNDLSGDQFIVRMLDRRHIGAGLLLLADFVEELADRRSSRNQKRQPVVDLSQRR